MLLFLLTRRTFMIQPPKKVGMKLKSTSVCNDYNESLEKKSIKRERERAQSVDSVSCPT